MEREGNIQGKKSRRRLQFRHLRLNVFSAAAAVLFLLALGNTQVLPAQDLPPGQSTIRMKEVDIIYFLSAILGIGL
jgi:hypothetical protein